MKVACVQVCAGDDMAANLAAVSASVTEAAAAGADFITTPENVALMAADRTQLHDHVANESDHPAVIHFSDLALSVNRWDLAGSIGVAVGDGRIFNRSLLFSPDGAVAARYDKIHMFDVDLDGGESYRESNTYQPGDTAVIAGLPWGRAGLTICYDVRFPALYTGLANAGADFIGVPSAFTRKTGRAHWHVLLRARAIETGCWAFAAAQCGDHAAGRQTYGHSLIVDPWGEIVAEAGEDFDISEVIREMQGEMQEAAARLEYEKAALLRDQIEELKKHEGQEKPPSNF